MAETTSQEPVERFRSRKQALDWLHAQNYKVSQGKFYADCRDGVVPVASDGSLSRYQVLLYGLKLDKGSNQTLEVINTAEDDARKAKADADMAEMKAEKMRREADTLWLHADDAWAAVAGLIGALRDSLRYHLHQAQRDIVFAAGGDQDRAHEVYELLEEVAARAFNDVAGRQVDIAFAKAEKAGEPGDDQEDEEAGEEVAQ